MARHPATQFTKDQWMARAEDVGLQEKLRTNSEIEYFNIVVSKAQEYRIMDWQTAVLLLHMVYGWMPRMLKIGEQNNEQRIAVPSLLNRAKNGTLLTKEELGKLMSFSNRSMVGASKLLHVLSPVTYPIWDSRVARVFLWKHVPVTEFKNEEYYSQYNNPQSYLKYRKEILQWVSSIEVRKKCKSLRDLNPALQHACDLRMVELVLFHENGQENAERVKTKTEVREARKQKKTWSQI